MPRNAIVQEEFIAFSAKDISFSILSFLVKNISWNFLGFPTISLLLKQFIGILASISNVF